MKAPVFSQPDSRKIRVLSIDGGGIRGVLPATILWYVESQIQQLTGSPAARLSDYFDLVAGTSTGGILTCLYLAPDLKKPDRARNSARQVLDLYMRDGGSVFCQSFSRKVKSMDGLLGKKYDSTKLERYLCRAIGPSVRMSQLVRPCLIPAYELHQRQPMFFKSHAAREKTSPDFFAWQVAQASASAPTYFEPAVLQASDRELLLADGGLFARNPSFQAYLEAIRCCQLQEGAAVRPPNTDDVLLVSVGTGGVKKEPTFGDLRKRGAVAWVKPLLQIMMSTGADLIDQQMAQLFAASSGSYYRLEPCIHEADVAIDNACEENLLALYQAGLHYISTHQEQLDALAEELISFPAPIAQA